jgi:CHAT domain-containing protein
VPVGAAELEAEARQFRRQLQDRTSTAYRASARRLYDWLVRPYAARVTAERATTLVFVPDGALRAIPMGALHDGEKFVAERFALATAPGLSLVDARRLDLGHVKPLLGGVSEAREEFAPLANVPRELEAIRALFGGEELLDANFRADRIESAIADSRPTLVHLASHAVFTGDPATSFLLTHDGRMTMDELAGALTRTRLRADPIELLVLSACDTALGDDRAALGLAGVAVRSGARSAVGSLWAIADDATYPLVTSFYRHLHEPGQSRAEALRRAQLEMLASDAFSHPFYWSAFVLISNWL